jgi:hypothetical protein
MNLVQHLRGTYSRAGHFLERQIWEQRLERLPAWRARSYLAARVAYTTLRGLLFEDTLHVRAAALTYFTVLSLVPLLAFAFACSRVSARTTCWSSRRFGLRSTACSRATRHSPRRSIRS